MIVQLPLYKGCSRNYPGRAHFFSDPSTPRTHMESRAPWPSGQFCEPDPPPPGHAHYRSKTPWPPGQVNCPTPRTGLVREIPHPSDTLSTKHPPPTGQKSASAPPPSDNFWNSRNTHCGKRKSRCLGKVYTRWSLFYRVLGTLGWKMETEDTTMIHTSEPLFLTVQKSHSNLSLTPLTDPWGSWYQPLHSGRLATPTW